MKNIALPKRLKTREGRLKFLRDLTGLKRIELENKYNIPEITIRKWENGRLNITSNGIRRCLEAYEKEGVFTTEKWVKEGIGKVPTLGSDFEEGEELEPDLNHFKYLYQNSVIHKMKSNNMFPRYKKGEIVFGVISNSNLENFHDLDCIISLKEANEEIVAKVYIEEKKINLISLNNNDDSIRGLMLDVSINFMAPIIWHRVKK